MMKPKREVNSEADKPRAQIASPAWQRAGVFFCLAFL
jgi:hypothetical protein